MGGEEKKKRKRKERNTKHLLLSKERNEPRHIPGPAYVVFINMSGTKRVSRAKGHVKERE